MSKLVFHSQIYYAFFKFYYPLLGRLHYVIHRVRHPSHNMRWKSKWGDMSCETCNLCIWSRCMDGDGASASLWLEREYK